MTQEPRTVCRGNELLLTCSALPSSKSLKMKQNQPKRASRLPFVLFLFYTQLVQTQLISAQMGF
jgi:hypothetical protein